jgi:hypothetical protein
MDIIKQAKFLNVTVTLWTNRIEIVTDSFLMGKKTQTIPLRNIVDVSKGIGQPLRVKTTDGKQTPLPITSGWEEWRKAIVEAM